MNNTEPHITILGGGPAGLATAYYAQKKGLPFILFEAEKSIGGNCRTKYIEGLSFDTGAHRFHDKDPEITLEVTELLGKELLTTHAPSSIYYDGKLIDFPISPLNLMKNLPLKTFISGGFNMIFKKLYSGNDQRSFYDWVINEYGSTFARLFLLNYTSKLYGTDPNNLTPEVGGSRLKGLNLKTFITEFFTGQKSKNIHLDGRFLYPKFGYGQITDKLAEHSGWENIYTQKRITRINRNKFTISSIEVNETEKYYVDQLVNTLPLPVFLGLLNPKPPEYISRILSGLQFQHLFVPVIVLDRKQISEKASLYFPQYHYPFTRIYEPKNRSKALAPREKTCILLEIPHRHLPMKVQEQKSLYHSSITQLVNAGLLKKEEISSFAFELLPYAYPVLSKDYVYRINKIFNWLNKFNNLRISGRGGKFSYSHLHDMMKMGKKTIRSFNDEKTADITQKQKVAL